MPLVQQQKRLSSLLDLMVNHFHDNNFNHLPDQKKVGENHQFMNKQTLLSFFRSVVQLVGAFLIGRHIFGHSLDANLLETFGESVVVLGTAVWGVLDKTVGIEQLQSAFRSTLTIITSLLASWGIISGQTALAIVGFGGSLIPVLQSYTSKLKVQKMDAGTIVPKPDGSGKVMKAAPKAFSAIIVLFLCCAAFSANAQHLFEPIPKLNPSLAKMGIGKMGVPQPADSTQDLVRPTIVASISYPGGLAQAGIGFAYQHMKYDYTNLRWQSLYSFGLYGLGGTNTVTGNISGSPLPPTSLQGVVSASFLIGFANDIVRVGPQYNFQVPPGYKTHWGVSVVLGLNLNN